LHDAGLAQLAEQLICNQQVIGSSPIAGSMEETGTEIMKYMLDIVLVLALGWLGWLWNGEKQNGLAQSDELDKLRANVARLERDLGSAKDAGARTATELAAVKAQLETTNRELLEKADALSAKTTEAEGLLEAGRRLRTRVAELEGYKAKAIVAEMPKAGSP
jgi:chromosome segregation ATPase